MTLSILICHIPERKGSLNRLLKTLNAQKAENLNDVEILVDDMPSDSIGEKRNRLLGRATGDYVAFIDDDDMVSGDYIALIRGAITAQPDCVGIEGVIKGGDGDGWKFRHSITVGRWCKDKRARIYFRTPNHLNPIKRQIASVVQFPNTSWGEDKEFSDNIKPLLLTEEFIESTIYYYNK